MPTAIWTGSISFGLVTVPVRLVSATKDLELVGVAADLPGLLALVVLVEAAGAAAVSGLARNQLSMRESQDSNQAR